MNERMLFNNVNSNQKMNYDYKNSINIIEYGSLPQIIDNNAQINYEKYGDATSIFKNNRYEQHT